MPPDPDLQALKVHTAPNGLVWIAQDDCVPANTGLGVAAFSAHLRCVERIRVLGTQGNAALLRELLRAPERYRVLEIAGPQLCQAPSELTDPALTLYRMRQSAGLGPSRGGWHTAQPSDRATYALIAYAQEYPFGDAMRALLQAHPAWPALSFIPHLNEERAVQLLSEVVDPRWFVNPAAPDRVSRLFAYLGLCPRMQIAVDADQIRGQRALRCRLVLDTWHGTPGPRDLTAPANFLWRVWAAAGSSSRGRLRASQKFIIFLRHVWMNGLYRDTRYGRGDGLFAPDLLFKTPAEIEAFRAHLAHGPTTV